MKLSGFVTQRFCNGTVEIELRVEGGNERFWFSEKMGGVDIGPPRYLVAFLGEIGFYWVKIKDFAK